MITMALILAFFDQPVSPHITSGYIRLESPLVIQRKVWIADAISCTADVLSLAQPISVKAHITGLPTH